MTEVLELDGSSLTVGDIARVAAGGVPVRVTSMARALAARAHADQTAARRPVYGRSTGVGGNRLIPLEDPTPAEPGDPALALLRSHASSLGPLRSPERVRATLVVRLNQLAAGGSGVDPSVIDGLATMLRADALPPIRELGGVGTGDLAALATTALGLLGEVPTSQPMPGPVRFGIGDALPLLSSNAATIADAALASTALRDLAVQALTVAAATFTGARGNPEAFSPVVEQVTPFRGAQEVCRRMRALIDTGADGARIQDPFALRALPQVHGPLLDSIDILDTVVEKLVSAPSENPVFLPEEEVAHHGGFHVAYLAQALDSLRLALVKAAQLSLARLSMLCDPAMTGLPAFLGDGRPGASGVMTVEYVVASALSSLRALATPAALQTVTLSHGVEEDASFASLAARQALDAVPMFRSVLAGEMVAAVRCLRARNLAPPPLADWLAGCDGLETSLTDRDLTADLLHAERLLTADQSEAARASRVSRLE
ncbi:MAG TPA: aromatic amino acid lyase [Jatrophihabitans sp.]|uniref:aromatic amino acid lyase n=1 Tax=Jatrophihabitans sp. TaxID=1932789 RepID=UPI002DF7E716|nr:aromatic amino acid lyase [Jatrophihabitans sp.]